MNFATLDWIAIGVPFAVVAVVAWILDTYTAIWSAQENSYDEDRH